MAKAQTSRLNVAVAMAFLAVGPGVATPDPGPRSLVAILDLPSPEFFEAISEIPVDPLPSVDDLWPILERCRSEADEVPEGPSEEDERARVERQYACGDVGGLLAGLASGAERNRVFTMLDSLGSDHWLRDSLLRGLVDGRLTELIRGLPAASPAAASSEAPPPVPDRLEAAPAELQGAWQLHEGLVRGYRSHLESAQERGVLRYLERTADFETTVADFLRGRVHPEDAAALIGRFVWGGGCGHGSDRLFEPQGRTLLLAYLQTGDRALAAGAALASSERGTARHPGLPEDWDRRLLGALGYDWEAVAVGRLLEGWPIQHEALGRHGSERAARLLLSARDVRLDDEGEGRLGDHDGYFHTLAAFVTPSGECIDYGTTSSLDVERAPDASVIGADVEAEILDLLEAHVGPGVGLAEAETAAHLLVKACRDESRPAFRAMLRSPYAKVREAGALALRSLGEKVARLPSTPPVVFRISVDGVPARGLSISGGLVRQGGGRTESSVTTDVEGFLRLNRDPFLDPKDAVEGVTLGPSGCETPEDLCFSVYLPRPDRLDRVIPISVWTQALTFSCPAAAARELIVFVSGPVDVDESALGRVAPIMVELSGDRPVTFPRLQRGRYRIAVFGDAGRWESEELELGDRPVAVECGLLERLEAGERGRGGG